ncbi:putative uncharacterized protein C8orf44, partial [Plecturocebus cupreus]
MTVIPALWEAEAGGSPEVRSSRPAWPTWQNSISTKNTKISQAWWCVPVIPATRAHSVGLASEQTDKTKEKRPGNQRATWEAEAGELLEPGGEGCSEPRSHHCTPDWRLATEQESVSKKKKKERKKRRLYNHCNLTVPLILYIPKTKPPLKDGQNKSPSSTGLEAIMETYAFWRPPVRTLTFEDFTTMQKQQ